MALRLKADHPHAFCNLGNALKDKGLIAEAQHCFASACRLLPNFSVAQNNLGAILKEQGKHRLAIAHFEEALACDPTFVEAYYNMGCSYKDLNMTEDAIRCFTAAIRARSDFADSYVCLGQCFLEVGRVRDAVVCMEKALELRPSFSAALVKCFDVKSRIADWSSHDVVREKIKSLIASEIETKKPFSFLTVEPFLALTYVVFFSLTCSFFFSAHTQTHVCVLQVQLSACQRSCIRTLETHRTTKCTSERGSQLSISRKNSNRKIENWLHQQSFRELRSVVSAHDSCT